MPPAADPGQWRANGQAGQRPASAGSSGISSRKRLPVFRDRVTYVLNGSRDQVEMRILADRLESAGKWAVFPALMLVVVSALTQCGVLLVAAFFFLGAGYLLPSIADWLRTRAALAEARSCDRANTASTSTLPPQTVSAIILRDQDAAQHGGDDWLELPTAWDAPSRTIH